MGLGIAEVGVVTAIAARARARNPFAAMSPMAAMAVGLSSMRSIAAIEAIEAKGCPCVCARAREGVT